MEKPINRAYEYYIVAGISTTIVAIFVILRLYVRFVVTRKPWWDDPAYTGVVIKEGTVGLGTHAWDVSMVDMYGTPSAILTAPAIYFTKLTLLLLYLRIFSLNRPVKLGIWAGIIFCTVFYTIVLFLYIFINETGLVKVTYAVAATGVVSDVYIICLPLFAIAQLHLSLAKKWKVAGVFMTGLLAVVMSFLGCIYRFHLDISDSTWSLLPIYIVNTVEVDIGIICTCLPLLAALFQNKKKESWWLTSFRSLRSRFLVSRASSHSSRRTGHINHPAYDGPSESSLFGQCRRVTEAGSEDHIKLVQPKATPETAAGTGTVLPPGQHGIWRETLIEQQWSGNR
ncbi:hypothetical protein BO94DRAFT_560745 [Aspergillus sclerotioniger CBS 115572]|uniref:Rhodopsin domain-containing protein n=1 Tax=Aspergillus sclerotioniger CBS 115572 TaxID=1450535 RepID=A0A317V8E2_9EURO|nr:hypothetical protein BO94DRAFT_560745 [Aspergillus sclerotioniger CBS 115572]PWY69649.1 hypothetical protein BO94DRAFT_560745 [Aspergillus sclerotioniger CBS 115572]